MTPLTRSRQGPAVVGSGTLRCSPGELKTSSGIKVPNPQKLTLHLCDEDQLGPAQLPLKLSLDHV